MPPDNRAASGSAPGASKKRSTAPKRNAIACLRCKERKARCVPAPPGSSPVPTCTNCLGARKECIYLDRTPNEIFLLEYVSQLESRCAALEMELRKHNPKSQFASDHIPAPVEAREAAVDKLNTVYPSGPPRSASDNAEAGPSTAQGNSAQAAATPLARFDDDSGKKGESGQSDEGDADEGDEADFALGMGMLSLGGGEEPVYVGPSSGVNWARVCASALKRPQGRSQPSHLSRFNYLAPPELASVKSALEYTLHHPTPPLPPPTLAAHYLNLVYDHVQARYGCFDWQTVRFWHENREAICQGRPLWGVGTGQDERRSLGAFFLWLCYGYGARLSEGENLPGAVNHEVYYNAAVACLSTLTSHHSLATVQALVLLTIYGFRHPTAEVSVWQVGGLSMRTAVEIGLHRRTRSKAERDKDPRRYEMKKRVFWAVYSLDRMMSAQLGRPSGIQDRDIDVELPLNVDVDFNQPKALAAMQSKQSELMGSKRPGDEYANGYGPVTSMTSAIHNIRLNQLKQMVTDAIYRLDKPLRPTNDVYSPERQSITEVDILLERLDQWRACHPDPPPDSQVPMLPKEHWELEYHNCVQMLLRPIIASRKAGKQYVGLCLESAVALCETQWQYLQPPVHHSKLSTWRFYRIFLAGMTLLHILTTFPTDLTEVELHRAEGGIRKCEAALGIWGERFRGAKRHEKLFKELVDAWETRTKETTSGGDLQTSAFATSSTPSVHNRGRPRPLQPPSSSGQQQSAQATAPEPPVDIMSQFLHLVNNSHSTPQPTQLNGKELPTQMQALFGADVACSGGAGLRQSEGLAQEQKARELLDAAGFDMRRLGMYTGMAPMANLGARQTSPDKWGRTGADGNGAEWTSDVTMHSAGPTFGNDGGLGIKEDFFSLISSFGIDTDTQTPLLPMDGSDPAFDFSAAQLGMSNVNYNYDPSPNAFDPMSHNSASAPPWAQSLASINTSFNGFGGYNTLGQGMNLGTAGGSLQSGGGMGTGTASDPNMGMSDWALFDCIGNNSRQKGETSRSGNTNDSSEETVPQWGMSGTR
ncbi:hypothetical protein I350_01638 [Cryptococcus amylolentus CBS 6273]|uniref:Zn(2)-C6 fungal-type domain-containing protein n=1 Tax=Cryptococcus amylolentus CBS 6273 TaxID=1296118 RepID=A0A1E3KEL8_9TREE|nr:hypothetical protein I350_01638 [Cryptococcus amylolentus CBS 6273]